jgi:hypothetical protein
MLETTIMSIVLLGLGFSTYYCLGKPLTLHHAVYRVFNDRITYYHLENKKLTVITDNFGWDGTGWSQGQAIRDGKRQINKLLATLPQFDGQVSQIDVTVTYLKDPVLRNVIDTDRRF